MNREPNTQYVLSLSYGKDSIACLAAIEQLGLPLDRIVHAEVWATDTISADLPPMVEFKKKADAIIKERWGIEVEHICAMKGGRSGVIVPSSMTSCQEESLKEQSEDSLCNLIAGVKSSNQIPQKLTYQDIFYRPITKPRTKKAGGKDTKHTDSLCQKALGATTNSKQTFSTRIYGFPYSQVRGTAGMGWCHQLKMEALHGIPDKMETVLHRGTQTNVFSDSPDAHGAKINVVQYLGIAADEPERIKRHSVPGIVLPLVMIGWEEAYCRKWCEENDLLSPIYTDSARGGCWFCHNQGVDQLRLLRQKYPDLWKLLLKWDNDSPIAFHSDGHTVLDFDKRFHAEEHNLIPTDRTFKWKKLWEAREMNNTYIFDCEVFAFDWLFVFKHKITKEYTIIHNDNELLADFIKTNNPLLAGFNNKHYDRYILTAALLNYPPEDIKRFNDMIISEGIEGWQIPELQNSGIFIDQYDLMDDCQTGLSLKAIEGHLGMDIRESTIDFRINRPLTEAELEETIFYCKHDVDATDMLDDLRKDYLNTKRKLGEEKKISPEKALYMTNAKLTAAYLDAGRHTEYTDEREYEYPATLKREYIPQEVFDFFDRLHDESIPSDKLFSESLDLTVGGCPCTIAYGGIHGAIPNYTEEATETRTIRNKDASSFYSNQMVLNGYCSRNIPSPQVYKDTIERRIQAKKSGDKATANALKLVLNTTYGAMLNKYNDLYDPKMGRSVCISGQLQLLEVAEHLVQDCPTLKIIQLNTDGIMISLDYSDVSKYQEITEEWQTRTGFTLEEDFVKKIIQKDVNNYVEVAEDGELKIKGGYLVRGIAKAGAFNVNNNATIVAKAVKDFLAYGTPVEQTINECNDIKEFQWIAKVSSKYGDALHCIDGEMKIVQRTNRVYATSDYRYGTLYKINLTTKTPEKVSGLPANCLIDNDNHLTIEAVDKEWYIRLAKKQVNDFLGKEEPKGNTRAINKLKKNLLSSLGEI